MSTFLFKDGERSLFPAERVQALLANGYTVEDDFFDVDPPKDLNTMTNKELLVMAKLVDDTVNSRTRRADLIAILGVTNDNED